MARVRPYGSPILIRHLPEDRRRRLARLRAVALIAIGVIAASGVALQEAHDRSAGQQVAMGPTPFDYFPG